MQRGAPFSRKEDLAFPSELTGSWAGLMTDRLAICRFNFHASGCPPGAWGFNKKKSKAKIGIPTVGKKLKFSKKIPIKMKTPHPEVPNEKPVSLPGVSQEEHEKNQNPAYRSRLSRPFGFHPKWQLSQSPLPLNKTLAMVKKVKFDLILSEPQQLAIMTPEKAR